MKEHPMIFSAEMVRALLEGRKTMTRRVIKKQPAGSVNDWTWDAEDGERVIYHGEICDLRASRGRNKRDAGELTPGRVRPPIQPGDRIWVREAWNAGMGLDKLSPKQMKQRAIEAGYGVNESHPACGIRYEADWATRQWGDIPQTNWGRYRNPIHMPRWASRITLEVKAVRGERVQEISEADALAEGVHEGREDDGSFPPEVDCSLVSYRVGFKQTWDTIHEEKPEYQWAANPWVWVYEFERIKP